MSNSSSGSENKSFFATKKEQSTTSNANSPTVGSPSTSAQSQVNQVKDSLVKSNSVLGKNIKFRGELIGTEDLHIEGVVDGVVIMEGHNLSVGEEGVLNANVHAQNLTIHGKLTGDVLADELIQVKTTAVVKGNLTAPRIQLDDGGKFRGSMDMTDTDQEKKDRLNDFKQKLVHPHLPAKNAKAPSTTSASTSSDSGKSANKPSFNKK
ncbi:MAG: bactofilin family protein [Kangiellaceae bacterium]